MQLIATRKYLSRAKDSRNIFSFGEINTCMKTFIATIRIKGQLVRTTVTADDAIHAKLLLQFLFGMSSIAVAPTIEENSGGELPDAEQLYLGDGLIKPISSTSPRSPEQAQLDALKTRKDQATQALKAARQRFKVTKAQKALQSAMQHQLPR